MAVLPNVLGPKSLDFHYFQQNRENACKQMVWEPIPSFRGLGGSRGHLASPRNSSRQTLAIFLDDVGDLPFPMKS